MMEPLFICVQVYGRGEMLGNEIEVSYGQRESINDTTRSCLIVTILHYIVLNKNDAHNVIGSNVISLHLCTFSAVIGASPVVGAVDRSIAGHRVPLPWITMASVPSSNLGRPRAGVARYCERTKTHYYLQFVTLALQDYRSPSDAQSVDAQIHIIGTGFYHLLASLTG